MDWLIISAILALLFFIYEMVRFGIRALLFVIVRHIYHRRDY